MSVKVPPVSTPIFLIYGGLLSIFSVVENRLFNYGGLLSIFSVVENRFLIKLGTHLELTAYLLSFKRPRFAVYLQGKR